MAGRSCGPRVGAPEVWEVVNLTPDDHPLHLHLATFPAVRARGLVGLDEFRRCMARLNDAARCNVSQHAAGDAVGVPEHERTWKNVGKRAPGHVTTAVVKFLMVDTGEDYPFDATAEPGYVYHCHVRINHLQSYKYNNYLPMKNKTCQDVHH